MTKDNVKTKGKELSNDTKTMVRNLVRLVESAALLTVSVYAAASANSHDFNTIGYKLLTVAAVLIGLRGGELFMRHLANK